MPTPAPERDGRPKPRTTPFAAQLAAMIPLFSPQSQDRAGSVAGVSMLGSWPRERLRLAALVLLLALWPWIGLFGREPWKPDEAYSFGLVWSMVQGKGLAVPLLAGEPFLEKPPLFYWTAAGSTLLFRGLPPHEAARLAIPLFLCVALGFLAATSRLLYGDKRGFAAIVLFVGSLGVFDKVHLLVTDVGLIAGLSIAYFGIALGGGRPVAGGAALGVGAGVAFMSKGLLGPGVLALTVAALLCFRSWRDRVGWRFLVVAALVATPTLLAWPVWLYLESPGLFHTWLWDNNLGRYLGFVSLGEGHGAWFYPVTLLWLGFPLWPLAIWAGAAAYRRRVSTPPLTLPAVALAVTLAVLMGAHQSRALYALPMVLPMSLLAVAGLDYAPPWAAAALQRVSTVLFATVAATLWLVWLSAVSGFPATTAIMLAQREPGFVARFSASGFAVAIMATILFGVTVRGRRVSPENAVCVWAAGLTTCWALVMTLWLPYLDYGMSYRSVAASVRQALPHDRSCIASKGLGEPQRAMLDYYAALVTLRLETNPEGRECAWLLVQRIGAAPMPPADARWEETWHGTRPGDGRENFYLFHRRGAS
jgi:4-amino-4-deoxy-L-arabinose transferase-like glycosyltransferase